MLAASVHILGPKFIPMEGKGRALSAHADRDKDTVEVRKTLMSQAMNSATPVTVVLVHGAFIDASSWNGVIQRLQARGVQVTAPANPLRGISADSAYLASVLGQIPGPVLAVGHSYGGAVISNAASMASNVVGLVFVAAFAPDEGERLGAVSATSKDSLLGTALMTRNYPTGNGAETAVEFVVDPAKVRDVFAADLSVELAAIAGATQRPVAELAFSEPNGRPAWRTLPSWAVVATDDKAAGTDLVRSMAARAGATITEVDGSHVIMLSQPQAVTDVILTAIEQTGAERSTVGATA
jgi:pimeloyl-ACP methyl ester carboxylesterase